MAPVKFEENIREKLEQRELKPSASAWERIEQRLDTSAKRKTKKGYAVWLVAAGFIGILILAGKFLFINPEINQNPVVAAPPEEPVEQNKLQQELFQPQTEQLLPQEHVVSEEKTVVENQNPAAEKTFKEFDQNTNKALAETKPLEEPVQQQVDAEVEKLLNNITEQQNAGVAYTDAEIDKLLRDAQRDIISEQILGSDRNAVSAEALLYEVEEELDPSFKDRVFEALKEGFLKAREAVASRND
ncbi:MULTISPECIES: hypothetical protein [unclassified Leeuwenhoekiella]|uniref:hypothetical protein n=1 Tax=unclassified Leeuwenhoekiella TaxID=2615029 RepID=UPI000C45402F|nr:MULTISPECIES: hypothetical protein [unclassified Leeuwenhoekiella]MAW96482.1 hypothetical protein [Leeuwenhoekiella sp.]MBA81369.1 hypothetical protein [Leeuwenhoekiella sp.]|tara:strand:- start:11920 stop:12651 length:732 start_codon:yes stop_codon:yes gene_type:complete